MSFFLIKSLLYVLSWIFKPFLIPGYFPFTTKHTQFLLPHYKINPVFGPVSLSIFFLVFGRTLWNNSLYFSLHCIYFLTSIWSSTLAFWLLSPSLPWYFFGRSIKKYLLPHQINAFFRVFPYLNWMRHFHFWQSTPKTVLFLTLYSSGSSLTVASCLASFLTLILLPFHSFYGL